MTVYTHCRRAGIDRSSVRAWQFIDKGKVEIPEWLDASVEFTPEFHRIVVIGAHTERVDTAYHTDWLYQTYDSRGELCIRVMGDNRFQAVYEAIPEQDTTTGDDNEDDLDDDVGEEEEGEDEEEEEDEDEIEEPSKSAHNHEREQRV